MKKLALMLLLAVAVASPALADPISVSVGSTYGPYEVNPGGEFTLHVISGLTITNYATGAKNQADSPSFQTFCLEANEYIYTNTTYTATLNPYAIKGGTPSDHQEIAGKDYVSLGTAWLYNQFASGHWTGTLTYDYTDDATHRADAALLQNAIWWLEAEEGKDYDSSNVYMAAVVAQFGSAGAAMLNADGAYGVSALNIVAGGIDDQSQLYWDGGSTVDVPDGGATLMLLGGALVGLGALRRKFRG